MVSWTYMGQMTYNGQLMMSFICSYTKKNKPNAIYPRVSRGYRENP